MDRPGKHAAWALALLLPAPTLGVLVSIVWWPGTGGQAFYFAMKLWLLALPAAWRLAVERKPVSLSPPRQGGFGVGIGLGLLISAIIIGGYYALGRGLVDPDMLQAAVAGNGLDQPARYFALAAYLTLANALMEEYVWRWFVYEKFRDVGAPAAVAVVLAAAGFTLHHVVALKAQFGWGITLLGSLGVFIGGLTWSGLYARYRSVWPAYVSHAIVDIAVFYVGWLMIF